MLARNKWHKTNRAQLLSAAIEKGYSLVFCFFLYRYFSCCLQAGNDSDIAWHFPGWQRAGLNESSCHGFLSPQAPSGFYSVQQMSKTHSGLGWEGEGPGDVTEGLILASKPSLSCSPASPALALCMQEGNSCGNGEVGIMCPRRRTVCCWHERLFASSPWLSTADSQTNHTWLRLRVLCLGGISRRRWHTGLGFQTLVNTDNTNFKLDIWSPSIHLGFYASPYLLSIHFTCHFFDSKGAGNSDI